MSKWRRSPDTSVQRVPHMERPYFQCIYRLCPNDWDPATPRRNHSFTSNEEDLHRSHPPSHGICVRSVERRTHRMSPTPARLICKKTLIVTPSSWEEVWIPYACFILQSPCKLSPYLSSLVPPLTSTKSGYSFRKESYPVPLAKKSAPCNYFLERPPSRGAVFKDVNI